MKIAIFGTSGWSQEVLDVCDAMGYKQFIFIVKNKSSESYCGVAVVKETEIEELIASKYDFIIGVGDNKIRKNIHLKFSHLKYVNVIHPTATFGRQQREKFSRTMGNVIAAGVRFTNNIIPGNFGIYNLNCTIGHDSVIEDYVNLAPGANISGNVCIEEGAYIGTNAAVIQGKAVSEKLTIGQYATIGAGAVVTKAIPTHVVVKGIPAK